MDQKKIDYDEISLVDILKVIWKYRLFIVVFCIIGILVAFSILFYIEKNKVINKDNYVIYSFEINLPYISFDQFTALKLKIQYDMDNGILYRNFEINKDSSVLKYYIKDLLSKEKKYSFSQQDFPINLLGFEISLEKTLKETLIEKIRLYIQNILFYNMCKTDIYGIKKPFLESKEILVQNIDKSSSEIFIFISKLDEKLDYIYYLRNLDIDKNYNQLINYINDLNISSYIIREARDLFIEMIYNNYQLIKNDSIILKENYIRNEFNLKSIIKKLIIITIGIIFIAIFMVFVIDFFKKNWKEIVK